MAGKAKITLPGGKTLTIRAVDGAPGRDADEAAIVDKLRESLPRAEDVAALVPKPKDGQDGAPGRDGKDGARGLKGLRGLRGLQGRPGKDGKDGRDGSPDTPSEIAEKLNTLVGAVDASVIRGYSGRGTIHRGGQTTLLGLTDTPDSYSGQSAKGVRVNAGETALEFYTVTDTDEQVKVSANDTTAGYLNGKLVAGSNITLTENNDGGNETLEIGATVDTSGLVPYTGATGDVNLGVRSLIAHALKADATDGLLIESSNGTDVGLLGPANTANVTWYGSHNYDTATASTIAAFGASKTLQSLSTATYPSLTELSYVKGVTSAIQTQLNGKQAAGTYVTGATDSTLTLTGTTLGLNLSSANTWTGRQRVSDFRVYDSVSPPASATDTRVENDVDPHNTSVSATFIYGTPRVFLGKSGAAIYALNLQHVNQIESPPSINWNGAVAMIQNGGQNIVERRTLSGDAIAVNRNAYFGEIAIFSSVSGTPRDRFHAYNGSTVFNEDGLDQDHRFEGDTDANLLIVDAGTDTVRVGNAGTSAKLNVRSTAEQQRWEYDASNYANVTVGSTGGVTFDAVGSGAKFTFSDALEATTVKATTAAGFISSDGSAGATGTFTTADAKTVTVKDGIITSIV